MIAQVPNPFSPTQEQVETVTAEVFPSPYVTPAGTAVSADLTGDKHRLYHIQHHRLWTDVWGHRFDRSRRKVLSATGGVTIACRLQPTLLDGQEVIAVCYGISLVPKLPDKSWFFEARRAAAEGRKAEPAPLLLYNRKVGAQKAADRAAVAFAALAEGVGPNKALPDACGPAYALPKEDGYGMVFDGWGIMFIERDFFDSFELKEPLGGYVARMAGGDLAVLGGEILSHAKHHIREAGLRGMLKHKLELVETIDQVLAELAADLPPIKIPGWCPGCSPDNCPGCGQYDVSTPVIEQLVSSAASVPARTAEVSQVFASTGVGCLADTSAVTGEVPADAQVPPVKADQGYESRGCGNCGSCTCN